MRIKPKPFYGMLFLFFVILLILLFILFLNLDDFSIIISCLFYIMIFLPGFIYGLYKTYIFRKEAYYEIFENKIILKVGRGNRMAILIKDVETIKVQRLFMRLFTKVLAIKVNDEAMSKYDWQPRTKKWDFFMSGLTDKQMQNIVSHTKKVNSRINTDVFEKNGYSQDMKNKINKLNKFRILGLVGSVFLWILLFFLIYSRLPLLGFASIFLYFGFCFIFLGTLIKKIGVYTNLFSLNQLFGEKIIIRGKAIDIIYKSKLTAGYFLFSFGVILLILGVIFIMLGISF